MELDVHLTREGEEPWGFELIGGADYEIPLTVNKVFPSSPASAAGLQTGDIVTRVGDRLATELSLEAANAIIGEAVGSVSLGICRGLYDPVLDDYEPIYEPIARPDSDLRSEPTEVQYPIQFGDPNDLSLDDPNILDPNITDPSLFDSGYMTRPITETRSLTASPFVPNTKPYRPFSTEPLEVPPLDDPIILNPNYKDVIGLSNEDMKASLDSEDDELLRLIPRDFKIEPKFKLPISEKYDPEYARKVKALLENCAEGGKRETQKDEYELVYYAGQASVSKATKVIEDIKEQKVSSAEIQEETKHEKEETKMIKEEVKFEKRTEEEMHMETIEQTALKIVDESIERAVSVTEEIQKEVEEELRASATRELQIEETEANLKVKNHIEELESETERNESIINYEEIKQNNNEVKVKESDELVMKEQQFVEQRRLSMKKEIDETIESGNVKRKSSTFEKENKVSIGDIERKQAIRERKQSMQHETNEAISLGTVKRQSMAFATEKELIPPNEEPRKVSQMEDKQFEHVKETKSSGKCAQTLESEGKQKAFMIGLQTIPHIKGFVQSSYHFDLLLRTFFVHLTDVMVALSRFILTQPTQVLESTAEKVIKEELIKDLTTQDEYYEGQTTDHKFEDKKQSMQFQREKLQEKAESEIKQEVKVIQSKQEIKAKEEVRKDLKENKKQTYESQQYKHEDKRLEDSKLKQSIAENEHILKKQERFVVEFEEERKIKSGAEMAQMTQRKSKDLTKKMDAVITEFETKTGIEDRLEVTEQRSRRSRSRSQIEEEVMKESDPLEWLDKVENRRASVERTDVTKVSQGFSSFSESKESKRSETKRESRSTKVKPGKQTYVAIVESHVYTNKDAILEDLVAEMSETASVKSSEEMNAALESLETMSMETVAVNNIGKSEEKQQAVEVITNALEEVIQEKQEVLEAVQDFESQITEAHSKSVLQESHTSVAAESTEIIEESKLDSFKSQEVVSKSAVITAEDNFRVAAMSTEEMILEETKEAVSEIKVSQKQAVAKLESLAIAVAESTDVVIDDSKLEFFEKEEVVSKTAKVASEETYKIAAVGTTDTTFEIAEEEHVAIDNTAKATIREETQHLAVAGIIETKTEFCKEPKKTAEDECASLKIVKEEVIDGGESVQTLSESDLNVKQSLDIEVSSSQHTKSSITQSHESIQSVSQKTSSSIQEASCTVQESSFVQESSQSNKSSKLHIRTDLAQIDCQISGQSDENNNTPSPSPVPPTPLTDEYVFKLEIPLPKNQGTIVVEDSPDREDPNIVKKGLIPYIETTIEDQIIYDPPLSTPTEDKPLSPVYTKPGLRGGAAPLFRKEYIREIERKSSLLASAIDQTIKSIEEYKEEVGIDNKEAETDRSTISNGHTNGVGHEEIAREDAKTKEEWKNVENQVSENIENVQGLTNGKMKEESANGVTENGNQDVPPGFKPVIFNPETYHARLYEEVARAPCEIEPRPATPYVDEGGEPLGTHQGIVDGLEDALVDEEVAKEHGKPGMTEETIAVLISGESEMLREAHVMGLSRVLTSHMTRPNDSSVDFQKIKPLVESLKDSEVLKALNEELMTKKKEEKKEKKVTTFLQKPKRPVPRAKFGYWGYVEPEEEEDEEPYKVKIVKQPKPKVAPDYKPEDFETGPLPWEERAQTEPVPSPVPPEDPILIPEETPQFLEAVDPLPESAVPDLEDTGISLPTTPILPEEPPKLPEELPPDPPEVKPVSPEPEPEVKEMHGEDQNKMAEQLVNTVKSMVDPNASLEQQLGQMRAQLAALAQLPCVIQQSLEILSRQLSSMSHQESQRVSFEAQMNMESRQELQVNNTMEMIEEYEVQEAQNNQEAIQKYGEVNQNYGEMENQNSVTIEEVPATPTLTPREFAALKMEEKMLEQQRKREEEAMFEQERRNEKEKKEQQENARFEQESRQVKQRAPRVSKPRRVFGPLEDQDRPVVLPGGRRWKGPKDAYNDEMIKETLTAQSEILQGKVMGINFMKYEKPPVSLDHLQNSETYKMIHNMEQTPMKRVELLTPVVAESDYRERCRSATPIIRMQTNGM